MKFTKILMLSLGLTVLSCDDYLDVNTSPNGPSSENITPTLALSGAIAQPYRTFATTANELGNVWMNNWAGNVNNITGAFTPEYNLQLSTSFRQTIWGNIYLNTANLTNIVNFDSENYDNHKAIALVMKTYYFQYLVDLYGDLPYSEAHNSLILNPAYDDDMAVYVALYDNLDMALDYINNADASDMIVANEDPVFMGDMAMWTKFANTLKLRLLLRSSAFAAAGTDADYTTFWNTKISELNGADFVDTDVVINPGYNNGRDVSQNPYYNRYGFTTSGAEGNGHGLIRATDHAIKFLNGTTTGVYDVRLTRIYDTDDGGGTSYVGVEQGVTGAAVPPALSPIGPGLLLGDDQDGFLLTSSESYFMQSEAVLKGYISGDAQSLFTMGITASFDRLDVSASAATYLINIDAVDGLGWTNSTDKLEAIMTQKWIALNGVNGIESFIDYTRTGYPTTGVSILAITPTGFLPKRLMYPTTEYVGNSANVPSLSLNQIFSEGPFWYVP